MLYFNSMVCLLGRLFDRGVPNKAGLKCPSVYKKIFDFNEIWHVCGG